MNIYRIFYNHRHDEIVVKRDKLLDRLQKKRSFTDEDILEIMKFKGVGPKEDYKNVNSMRVTSEAFIEPDLNKKMMILRRLRGVGMVMASAILSFQNPYEYASIDTPTWNLLVRRFGFNADEKKGVDYSIKEYQNYMQEIKAIANEYGMKPVDVELTLYLIDKKRIQ